MRYRAGSRLSAFAVSLTLLAPSIASPPPVLVPYIKGGSLEPGDYKWARGRFDDANPSEKANDRAIVEWLAACKNSDTSATRDELARLEITGSVSDDGSRRTEACEEVQAALPSKDSKDWSGFLHDVAIARSLANAYLSAIADAEQMEEQDSPNLADELKVRRVGDQMLRRSYSWADGERSDSPKLTKRQQAILASEMIRAGTVRDHSNTEWLKAIVAKQGWPTISQFGKDAAGTAWLLAQHADADPAFQLRVLRLMEPLVATNEVRTQDYAYLYDRVMLKLKGTQRYATQMTCRDGVRVPLPLEDQSMVEARRREVGLGTLVEYQKLMARYAGDCPAAPRSGAPAR